MDLLKELDELRTAAPPTDIQKERTPDLVWERDQLIEKLRAVTQKGLDEKRALTPEERGVWDRGFVRAKEIKAELQRRYDDQERRRAGGGSEAVSVAGNGSGDVISRPHNGEAPLIFRTKDGREIRAVRSGESFAAAVGARGGPGSDLSVGQFIRAAITGARSPAEQRALAETTLSGGSYLIPQPLANELIDILRNATQVVKAGAITLPMDSSTLAFARATADPAVAWKAELEPIVPADPGIEGVLLTAHTLVGMTIISVEVAEDAIGGEGLIASMLGKALAQELDRVALVGSGTPPEPRGVLGATDVQTTAHDAPLADYAVISDAIAKLWTANVEPNGLIWHPSAAIATDKFIADGSGQPLLPPPSVAALPKYRTNQIPLTGSATPKVESVIFVGDWRELMIGMRTEARVEVSRTAPGAFENLAVAVRVYLRADIALRHPKAFCTITGVGKAAG